MSRPGRARPRGHLWSFYILRWWGRRFRLPAGTGPRPALRRAYQPGRNRVFLDICYGPLYLTRITKVMVEGFVLPERLPSPAQDSVCASGRRPFQPSHQHRYRDQRENQQMHVVRHYHPGTKMIEVPLALSDPNGVGDLIGNPRVPEPSWSRGAPIQDTIGSRESVAGSGVRSRIRSGRK
jgi:hypothetical protein